MPCDYSKYPANFKTEIRPRILARAGQTETTPAKCEKCRVANHAVGYRDSSGKFWPNAGTLVCDASGQGEDYPQGLLSYADARNIAEQYNCAYDYDTRRKADDFGNHWFVIVLTIAHLDHEKNNNADTNLRALCQRCHLVHDKDHHATNRKETRRRKTGQGALTYA